MDAPPPPDGVPKAKDELVDVGVLAPNAKDPVVEGRGGSVVSAGLLPPNEKPLDVAGGPKPKAGLSSGLSFCPKGLDPAEAGGTPNAKGLDGAVLLVADPKPEGPPPNEKLPPVLRVSLEGSALLISLVGLSSIRISLSSFLGGVEGRAAAGAPK